MLTEEIDIDLATKIMLTGKIVIDLKTHTDTQTLENALHSMIKKAEAVHRTHQNPLIAASG